MYEQEITAFAAKVFSGRDWHELSSDEQYIVKFLEAGGFITRRDTPDGFVGKVITGTVYTGPYAES